MKFHMSSSVKTGAAGLLYDYKDQKKKCKEIVHMAIVWQNEEPHRAVLSYEEKNVDLNIRQDEVIITFYEELHFEVLYSI